MPYDRTYGGYRVFVGDLGSRIGKYELEREFEYYGHLMDVWVARNPPGFAFLVYKYAEDAEKAVQENDGRNLLGHRIRVELARPTGGSRYSDDRNRRSGPPMRRGGGGYGGGGTSRCYACGGSGHFARNCKYDRKQYSRSRSRSRDRSRRRKSRSRSRSASRSRSRSRSRRRSRDRKRASGSRSRSRSHSRSRSRSASADRKRSKSRSRSGSPKTNETKPPVSECDDVPAGSPPQQQVQDVQNGDGDSPPQQADNE